MAERDGILKRGNVWHVRTDPITRRQVSTGKRTRAGALAWLGERHAEARRRAEDPRYAAAQASLSEWCAVFLGRCKERGVREATLGIYEQKLGHWVRVLGEDATMHDVTQAGVDRFISQRRAEGVGAHTIHKECAVLVRMLKVAKRGGVWFGDLDVLIPEDITPQYQPRERALGLDEVQRLLGAFDRRPDLAALVAVSAALGLRLSEALKLSPEDIDLDTGKIQVRGTKTAGASRTVPVLSLFRPLLEAALPVLPLGDKPSNLYRDLAVGCKRAGIDYCTPNDLRRSHATILLEHEVSPDVVRRLLGHTSDAMLRRVYGRTSAESLGEQAEGAIGRRVFVASDGTQERQPTSESHASARNQVGPSTNTIAGEDNDSLPKPKVARSNRAGGALLSRRCRVELEIPQLALAYAALLTGVLPANDRAKGAA